MHLRHRFGIGVVVAVFLTSLTPAFAQSQDNGFGQTRDLGSFRARLQKRIEKRRAKQKYPEDVIRSSLMHNNEERTYALLVPQSAKTSHKKMPLVIVLHGGGGNSYNAMSMSGFNEKAREEGFAVAYPDGSGKLKKAFLTWNAGHCCGYAMNNTVDDVGFISKLIDKLVQKSNVDPDRVYVTGMSNGGMMTHRIGIELSDKIAAIAPVVATLFGDEKQPKNPVAAVIFNGLLDKSVVYEGGTHGGRFAHAWDDVPPLPVEAQAQFWAKANGSTSAPQISETQTLKQSTYRAPNGKDVIIYIVKDNGHAWPGGKQGSRLGDPPSQSIDATDVMWDFFKKHPR